jgi:peptidoglycan/LPS O-acetylase OafA/YrhL
MVRPTPPAAVSSADGGRMDGSAGGPPGSAGAAADSELDSAPVVPGQEPGLSYIPALDGVRAFAVVGVMAYHGGIPWLPAGFLGVDAFFVLSGFLITSLLISEWQRRHTIGLGQFWARRARRLLPALLLLLVFVVLYAAFVAPAGTYPGLRLDALSTLFYVANWHFILIGGNYFNQTGLPSLLTHTWSLAVEEQFYLLWPPVVLGVLKFTGRLWVLLTLSAVGALASATEMALLFRHGVDTTRLYYGTDTHGQCLLVGAALASGLALFAERRRPAATRAGGGEVGGANPSWAACSRWARVLLSVFGGGGLVGAGLLWWRSSYNGSFLWEGGFLVAALATAAVLVCVVCVPRSWLGSALSVSPLRYLGRISYGLYLWHFPLFQWIDGERTGLSGYTLFGARCGATLAVATVSFSVVERPIRQGAFFRQWRAWAGAPMAVAAVSLTVVLATGSGTLAAAPVPSPGPAGPSSPSGLSGPSSPSRAHTTVLMLGDSTALTLGLGLSFDAARYDATLVDKGILGCGVAVVPEVSRHGVDASVAAPCNPLTPASGQWPALWTGWIDRYHPTVVAVLAGRSEISTVEWEGRSTDILAPAFAAYVRQQLQRAVDVGSSGGAAVVLFTAPCYDSGEQFDGAPWPEDQPDRLNAYNALVRQVVAANPQRATLINLDGLVCPGGTFETQIDGVTVRAPDGVHFPYSYDPGSPSTALDTLAQVSGFGAWIGVRLWPSIVAAGHEKADHIESR